MKHTIEINSYSTRKIICTSNIYAPDNITTARKLGLAVEQAVRRGVDLTSADLAGVNLAGLNLAGVDLTNAKLMGANMKGVDLTNAKLRGTKLMSANLAGANMKGVDLLCAYLIDANLTDVDLTDADLSGVNLMGANMEGANMGDLIIPIINNIHQTVYNAASRPNALNRSVLHSIRGTAHCRAGWVVTLAGDAGLALEAKTTIPVAAYLIYSKSDPDMKESINFYADNRKALKDMKKLADKEALNNHQL